MGGIEILTPVVIALAFIGYVSCLMRALWVTLMLTFLLALFVSRSVPFAPENIVFWGAGGGAFLLAAIAAALMPRSGPTTTRSLGTKQAPEIVVDGTNVIYWGGEPDLATLRDVVDQLKVKGLQPLVFLDASSRHHLGDKSLDEKRFAKALGLARNRVMVCPARTEADAFILKYARERQVPIVSNDRFGDRLQQVKGLKLIKGGVAGDRAMLLGL